MLAGQQQGDNHIALDPETFEVVRQIQELRKTLSSNSSSTTAASGGNADPTAPGGPGTTASATAVRGGAAVATAEGENPTQVMNDEKLINLFLRMAGRESHWPPGTAGGNDGSTGGSSDGSQGAAAQAAAPAPAQSKGSQRQEHGVNVDAVLDGLAAQMSIDDGMDASRADAPVTDRDNTLSPPPLQDGEQRFGGGIEGAGGAQLARLQKDKVNTGRKTEKTDVRLRGFFFFVTMVTLATRFVDRRRSG